MSEPTEDRGQAAELPHYRVVQYRSRALGNGAVSDFEELVTHHPDANANARLVNGVLRDVEEPRKRSHAMVGGEVQEVETRRTDGGTRSALGEHQVLLTKDLILEDSRIAAGGNGVRSVDVPAPFAGYVGRAGGQFGTVDIYDRKGGTLIARVLHLNPIQVAEDTMIEYGQALGTQSNKGLPQAGKHVHMEVDTAYYQQYENYVADLVSGRLAIDTDRRTRGIEPLAVVDDGVIRVGESSERVRDVQRHLNDLHIRDANNQELPTDGIYRLSMQAAVIRFQQAQGLPVTGDLDAATLRMVPRVERREVDRPDYTEPGVRPLGAATEGASRPALEPDPLHAQAKAAVQTLDHSLGREYDAASDRMSASLTSLARQNGFERIDRVVLSVQNDHSRAGENVFIVQGDLNDPGRRLAHMKTHDALAAPIEQSSGQFHGLSLSTAAPAMAASIEQSPEAMGPRLRV